MNKYSSMSLHKAIKMVTGKQPHYVVEGTTGIWFTIGARTYSIEVKDVTDSK